MDLTGQEKSFALAVAVIQDRVRNLSQEDKEDLFSLVPALFNDDENDDEEEQQAVFKAAYEIIHPIQVKVKPMQCFTEPIQNWLTFVSAKIRAAREEAGMTQEQLAEATGLHQSHISRLEKGEHSPTAKTLNKIADAIGVEASYFDPAAASLDQ